MTKDKEQIYEKDLFPIIKDYFEKKGYKVNAEVRNCDVVVQKENYFAIIELKLALNITLIHQALNRLTITENVYIAIKKPKKNYFKERQKMLRLVKRLNIGLIVINPDIKENKLEILFNPKDIDTTPPKTKKGELVKKEISGRKLDLNKGGVNKTKLLTAYKDLSIRIACICEIYTIVNVKFLKENFDIDNAYSILYNNFHGYFIRYGNGDYGISDKGLTALNDENIKALADIYRKDIQNKLAKDKEEL
ncbi:MAG: DUF2161 family putative PD-(D/E)XK-type phosphodiesterase [Lachnospirales bacterium]